MIKNVKRKFTNGQRKCLPDFTLTFILIAEQFSFFQMFPTNSSANFNSNGTIPFKIISNNI